MKAPLNVPRLSRIVLAASLMVLAPVGGVANAQTTVSASPTTCAILQGPLSASQESLVNSYQVLVARANSKHSPVPAMPDNVFALIGCLSPSSQTQGASVPAAATPTPAPSATTTTATSSGAKFTCPTNGLSKAEQSAINDYEIAVAKANSKHTSVPAAPADVAAFMACD